ncbi:hypothetical protein C9427_25040 [Mesorhizobium helmanticense]|uniref:Uncharacterized protein n=1 Tax=Mesorhizobium helmanticense TaxID=1776423 RepID=A0A2T4IQ04_9HYPH|nr:hypothetical protein C9427_25040 [Mesorhizobium helmanticense]
MKKFDTSKTVRKQRRVQRKVDIDDRAKAKPKPDGAPAYVFLASPQCSSHITGEIPPIVGGEGLRISG